MREEFEAHERDDGSTCLDRSPGGDFYVVCTVQLDWMKWQAAYAAGQRDGGQWRMSVDEALIQHGLDCTSPDNAPLERLTELTRTCHRMAVDPAVSADAAALIEREREACRKACREAVLALTEEQRQSGDMLDFAIETAIRNRTEGK